MVLFGLNMIKKSLISVNSVAILFLFAKMGWHGSIKPDVACANRQGKG